VVRGGDTLVIGGQVVRKKVNTVSGLPGLRDIPLFNALTSTKGVQYETFVRVYVVRPTLLGEDSSYASVALNNERAAPSYNAVLQKVPDLVRGISMAPEAAPASKTIPADDSSPRVILIPQPRMPKSESSGKATDSEASPVSQSMSQDGQKAPSSALPKTVVGSPEFKVDPRKQQLRDREAQQILETELAKAKQDLRKLERDVANGSQDAKEAAKRVQSDIDSIQRELQRLAVSATTSMAAPAVR
jgi:hypothetical protein